MHEVKKLTDSKAPFPVHHPLKALTKQISHYSQLLKLAVAALASSQKDLQKTLLESDQKIMAKHLEDLNTYTNVIDDSINFQEDLINPMARIIKFSPREIVTGFVATYRSDKEITMTAVCPTEDQAVFGNLLNLKRILTNLISNAEKFTPPKGKITITLTYPKSTPAKTGIVLEFSVKDSGKGMTEETMQRIFTPYAQGGKEISSQYGGTGLGLATCKTLVEKMGGAISVSSVKDQGSIFTFTIVCHAQMPTETMETPIASPTSEESILSSMHDARNITGWLIAYCGFIKETTQTLKKLSIPVTNIEKAAQSIKDCAEAQRHLINQTLDYSKLALKKTELHVINFKPTAVVSDVISIYRKRIVIIAHYPKENKELCGDAGKLKQILTSLIHYAISLTSKTARITIHLYTDSFPLLEFKVVFSGNFESRYDDTDLNLRVYKELVNLMKGTMFALSARTELIFTFKLPYQLHSPVRSTSKSKLPALTLSTAQQRRILVVDDQLINRLVIKKLLNKLGYEQIVEAGSGKESFNKYKAFESHNPPFHFIFMDIQMASSTDGIEAIRQIRTREQEQKKLPAHIVALSGNNSSETQQDAKAAGMNEFFIKPIKANRLKIILQISKKPRGEDKPKAPAHPRRNSLSRSASDNLGFFHQQHTVRQKLPLIRSVSNPSLFQPCKPLTDLGATPGAHAPTLPLK